MQECAVQACAVQASSHVVLEQMCRQQQRDGNLVRWPSRGLAGQVDHTRRPVPGIEGSLSIAHVHPSNFHWDTPSRSKAPGAQILRRRCTQRKGRSTAYHMSESSVRDVGVLHSQIVERDN